MDKEVARIFNLLIALVCLCMGFAWLLQMVPTQSRMVMSLMRSVGKVIWRFCWQTPYRRRGVLFAAQHILLILAIGGTIGAVNSGTNWGGAITLWAAVIVVKWLTSRLRKLRSSRQALPSRRRW